MIQRSHNQSVLWILLLITMLGAFLRLLGIDGHALWLDEAYSVWFAKQDWQYLWQEVPNFETHPPLYYSILKLALVAGDSVWHLRLPSAIASIITIPVVYYAATLVLSAPFKHKAGLLAALLTACAPLQIFFAQDARPYAFYMLAMSVSFAATAWLVRYQNKASLGLIAMIRQEPSAMMAFAALIVGYSLMLWFHNLGGLFVAGYTIFWLYFCCGCGQFKKNLLRNLMVAACCVAALYAPWLPHFLGQFGALNQGDFWLKAPSLLQLLRDSAILFAPYQEWMPSRYALVIYALSIFPLGLAGGLVLLRRQAVVMQNNLPSHIWLVLIVCTVLLPWLLNVLITYGVQPIFLKRILSPLQIGWFIVLASAPFFIKTQVKQTILMGAIAGFTLIAAAGYHVYPERHEHGHRPWADIIAAIAAHPAPQKTILTIPNNVGLVFEYYNAQHNNALDIIPLPATYPAPDAVRGMGVPDITEADIAELVDAVKDKPHLWLARRVGMIDKQRKVDAALKSYFTFTPLYQQSNIEVHYLQRIAD